MVSLITASKAQKKLVEYTRSRRLNMDLTQAGLAGRAGVPLSTLRKFEQQGTISLEAFLKLYVILGGLEDILKVFELEAHQFSSIDEVLNEPEKPKKQRGRRK
jgi:transcriptional regulator with XRE-family HTH domain